MPAQVEIKLVMSSWNKWKKFIKNAGPKIQKEVEIGLNEETRAFIEEFRKIHLDAKPIKKYGRKVRNPSTPYPILTRISTRLYDSMVHKVEVGGKDINVRAGFLPPVLDYAPKHVKRIQLVPEWKKWTPKFVKRIDKAVAKGLK